MFFCFLRLYSFLVDETTPKDTLEHFWDREKPLVYGTSSDCVYVIFRSTVNRFVKESERRAGISGVI